MTRNTFATLSLAVLFTFVTFSLATADIHYTITYQPPYERTVPVEESPIFDEVTFDDIALGLFNPVSHEDTTEDAQETVQVDGYYRISFGAATTSTDKFALDSWTAAAFKVGLGMQAEMITNHTFSADNVLTIPVPYPDTMEDEADYINPNYPKVRVPALYRYMHGKTWTDAQLARGKKSSYFKKENRRIADGLQRRVGDLVLVIDGYGECKHTTRTIDGTARTFIKAPKPTLKLNVGSDGDTVEVDDDTWQEHAGFPQGRISLIDGPETAHSPSLQRAVGTQAVTWGSLKARK